MKPIETPLSNHRVVSREKWLKERTALLAKEKELTRLRDELSAARRELPWVRVEKNYAFDTPDGRKTLADLFEGRSQLIVQHFMFAPQWKAGCVGCSFLADHIQSALVHLEHHDVSFAAVSRAPLSRIADFRKRMGWGFRWVSSIGSDFNYDYHVSFTKDQLAQGRVFYNYTMTDEVFEELHGLSVFYKNDAGVVFHTYSSYARGHEDMLVTYMCLDRTPKGRNETGQYHDLRDWVRHHDRYDDDRFDFMDAYQPVEGADACCGAGKVGT